MKKYTLALGLALALVFTANTTVQAQEQGTVRVGIDFGLAFPGGGLGFMFDVEPKYNLTDNMNVGIRFGVAIIAKVVEGSAADGYDSADLSANSSYLGTFDYYFPLGGSFTPFVGAGLGVYRIASMGVREGEDFAGTDVLDASTKFGGMIRGGFEVGKFRMTLEYDLIPKSKLQNNLGEEIGTIKNGYFGVSIGFFIGGGRWG